MLLALGAGMLWGLSFVAPQMLPSFGAVEISLGRYFFYGAFSAILLVALGTRSSSGATGFRIADRRTWPLAFAFAFTGHVGMYLLLVIGIRFAGAPVATAIIGTIPVVVAVTGNLIEREFPWRLLALPLTLILPGLMFINLSEAGAGSPVGEGRLFGLLCVLGTVGMWTFYGVVNARFLRANPSISGPVWSTTVGVATLVLVVLAVPLVAFVEPGAIEFRRLLEPGARLAWFLAVCAVMGIAASWGATLLWNGASVYLPTSLAGQLIVSEILAGLFYVFLADGRFPSAFETVGILAVVTGVLLGIHRTSRAGKVAEPQEYH